MGLYIRNKAIVAVYYARPDDLIDIIDNGRFDMSLLENIGHLSKPFPIWRISQCWDVVSRVEDWKEEFQPVAIEFRRRNDEIIRIFKERLGVEFTPIDYQAYHDDFYCDYPDETPADQLMVDSTQELLDAGVRQIDIDLYCAVAKFYFDEAKDLLEKGANPAAWLPDPFPSGFQVDDHIGAECSYLGTMLYSDIEDKGKSKTVYHSDLPQLLGWAAFETMYRLIEKYRQHPHYQWPEEKEEENNMQQ